MSPTNTCSENIILHILPPTKKYKGVIPGELGGQDIGPHLIFTS
jgi:hypothetical protein